LTFVSIPSALKSIPILKILALYVSHLIPILSLSGGRNHRQILKVVFAHKFGE
jgi:hypothetical protein